MASTSDAVSSNAPPVRAFQLDSNATGNAQDSVNLFRGQLSFPLKLVSLPGPNGMDLDLSALYSGALGQQPDLDNLAAPTGVLGLGWSLGFDFIEFQSSGTTSYLQGRFLAQISGGASELVLLEWRNAGGADEVLEFADPQRPLWQFRYRPPTESWEVLRDDGVSLYFGDRNAHPDSVQWGVRWGNWTGSSANPNGSPQRYGQAWNLNRAVDVWGNTIAYAYDADESEVGGGLRHTRASYLKSIRDALGREVRLNYEPKDRAEYQPPHTVDDHAPERAYQDRYQTRYLRRLSVHGPSGVEQYALEFDSRPVSLSANGAANAPLTDTAKRYLLGVRQIRGGHDVLPPILFEYDWRIASPSRGRMNQQTYPSGGVVRWDYRELELGDSPVFDLDFDAKRPEDPAFKGAEPRLWFGDDYVVIAWYAKSFGRLRLQFFQYGGRWTQAPFETDLNGVAIESAADLRVAFGRDFLALHFHNRGAANDTLHVFQKVPYQFGRFEHLMFPGIRSGDALSEETALVAGSEFVALHPGGVTGLSRISFDRRSRQWSPAPGNTPPTISGPRGETRMALAASSNVLAVGFISAGSTVSAIDQVYWLDTAAPNRPEWRNAFASPTSGSSFSWNPRYVFSYLRLAPGFAVSTAPRDGRARMQVISWERNFTGFQRRGLDGELVGGDGLPAATEVAIDAIANAGYLYRWNGSDWESAQYGWSGRAVALQSDQAIAARLSAAGFDARNARFDPLTTASGQWSVAALQTPNPAPTNPSGPQISERFLSLGANLWWLDTNGHWTLVGGAFAGSPGEVVANRGPVYLAYETSGDPTTRSTRVAVLINGQVDGEPRLLAGQRIGDPASSGITLAGPSAFATYPSRFVDFRDVPEFTLHRILDRQIGGFPRDCVVERLVLDTGPQQLHTVYSYDVATAVFDASGTVAQFPKVTAERRDAAGRTLGASVYEFLNGLAPESPSDPLDSCYSLAAGFQTAVTEFADAEPGGARSRIGHQKRRWTCVLLSTRSQGGFSALAGLRTIRQLSETNTRENLAVIQPADAGVLGEQGTLSFTVEMDYLQTTAAMRTRRLKLYSSGGQLQLRETRSLYAWEVYPGMRNPSNGAAPQFTAVAQTTLISDGQPAQSYAASFREDWAGVKAWASEGDWRWTGGGTIANGVPVFDFADPAKRSDWLAGALVEARNSAGLATLTRNAAGLATTSMFSSDGLLNVANAINSDGRDAQFAGFESYEPESGWQGGVREGGDAHTGFAAIRLAAGQGMRNTKLRTVRSGTRQVLAAYVKSSGSSTVTLSITAGSAAPVRKTWTVGGDWQYLWLSADAGAVGSALDVSITNTSGGSLLVDDVQCAPLDANLNGLVYNPATLLRTASVGQAGQTTQVFYDHLLNPIAQAGPDSGMSALSLTGYARDGFDHAQSRFNVQIQSTPLDGGSFDLFSDPDWQRRWTSSQPAQWSVRARTLLHSGSAAGEVALRDAAALERYAICVRISNPDAAAGDFGIGAGADLRVRWASASREWQLIGAGGSVLDRFAMDSVRFPAELMLVVGRRSAVVFLDREQILSALLASPAADIKGAPVLFSSAPGLGFAQFLLLLRPKMVLSYLDGVSQLVQTQQLLDGELVVSASFNDPLGRPSVNTKPAIIAGAVSGYRTGFATAPDPARDWRMDGEVSRYYDGSEGRSDDEGYPYFRERFELSAWGRRLESGLPGRTLAIRANNPRTTRRINATNAADPFFGPAPAGQYSIERMLDPDGLSTTSVRDVLGNVVASSAGGAPGSERQLTSITLDLRDNPVTVHNPASFDSPGGDPKAFVVQSEFDLFGQPLEVADSDSGVTRQVYDRVGNLRFEWTADSQSSDPVVNPAAPRSALRYFRYDVLNRIQERGWVAVDGFDRSALNALANSDWPQNSPGWQLRYRYDEPAGAADTSDGRSWGRLVEVLTRQADGSVVSERFSYDTAGNPVSRSTEVPGAFAADVRYAWNHVGKIVRSEIPSLIGKDVLSIERSYDDRGLLQRMTSGGRELARYEWNASGDPAREVLGATINDTTMGYTSPGQPERMLRQSLGQTLRYTEGVPTPRFDGLLAGTSFQYNASEGSRWNLKWDNAAYLLSVNDGAARAIDYRYDANGNRTAIDGAAYRYFAGSNRLQRAPGMSQDLAYSPAGNRIADAQWNIGYDFVTGLVTTMRGRGNSDALEFRFGASAQRLRKRWIGAKGYTRDYLPGAGRQAVTELTRYEDGRIEELRYVHGPDGIIAMLDQDGLWRYTVRDFQRSLRQVLDAQGNEIARVDYLPFGEPDSVKGADQDLLRYRYTGQEWDAETGLYNFRHRLYDATVGQFLSPDAARQFFSPYQFVGNNPLQHIDPNGEFSLTGFLISAAELVGGLLAIPLGLGALTVPLWGAGIAGLGYSIKTNDKDFDFKTFAQVEVGGAIAATEIAAGIAITVVTDGAGGAIGGASLIGAGFSGLIYSATAGNDYNWVSYSEQQLIGAIGGIITGGLGAIGGVAAGAVTNAAGKFAIEASFVFLGGFTSSMTSQTLNMAFDGKSASEIFSSDGIFSARNLINDAITGGVGVLGSAGGKALQSAVKTTSPQPGVLYNLGSTPAPSVRMPVFGNIVRTGQWIQGAEDAAAVAQYQGWALLKAGAVQRIPKVVTPLAFNSKKLWSV